MHERLFIEETADHDLRVLLEEHRGKPLDSIEGRSADTAACIAEALNDCCLMICERFGLESAHNVKGRTHNIGAVAFVISNPPLTHDIGDVVFVKRERLGGELEHRLKRCLADTPSTIMGRFYCR